MSESFTRTYWHSPRNTLNEQSLCALLLLPAACLLTLSTNTITILVLSMLVSGLYSHSDSRRHNKAFDASLVLHAMLACVLLPAQTSTGMGILIVISALGLRQLCGAAGQYLLHPAAIAALLAYLPGGAAILPTAMTKDLMLLSSASLLLAGSILLWRKALGWHSSAVFLAITAFVATLSPSAISTTAQSPLLELIQQPLWWLTAVYLLNDQPLLPISKKARALSGLIAGLSWICLSSFTGAPDSLAFIAALGILASNLFGPWLDSVRQTQSRNRPYAELALILLFILTADRISGYSTIDEATALPEQWAVLLSLGVIVTGITLALWRQQAEKPAQPIPVSQAATLPGSKRVRTTGEIK